MSLASAVTEVSGMSAPAFCPSVLELSCLVCRFIRLSMSAVDTELLLRNLDLILDMQLSLSLSVFCGFSDSDLLESIRD